jgi:hypothetical protein
MLKEVLGQYINILKTLILLYRHRKLLVEVRLPLVANLLHLMMKKEN